MTDITESAGEGQQPKMPKITPERRAMKLPARLRELDGWLVWRYESYDGEAKPRKVPYYTNGNTRSGKQGSADDRARLTSYAYALRTMIDRRYDGIGLAMLDNFGLTAIDIDNCIGPDGELPEIVKHLAARTCVELSPSGQGVRAFLYGDLGNHKSPTKGRDYGLETFHSSGYVTVTGNVLPLCEVLGTDDKIGRVDDYISEICEQRFGSLTRPDVDPDDPFLGLEPRHGMSVAEIEALLAKLDPGMGRGDWIKVGMALHHETQGDDTGFYLWNDWSSGAHNYRGEQDLRTQWDSFDRREGQRRANITMATAKMMAKEAAKDVVFDSSSATGERDDWPDPLSLPEALPPVPAMTPDMLPEDLRDFALDIAERMSVPLDFTGVPSMIMASSLIGSRMTVRPEQYTDWTEAGNLWGCLIAAPGAMKTPAIREVLAPLRELEAEAQTDNERAREKYQTELAFHKLARDAAEKECKGLLGNGRQDRCSRPSCRCQRAGTAA